MRAADLAAQLPYGSQVWLAVEINAAWTTEAHMAAFQLDAMAGAAWQRGGSQGPPPTPWPRPEDVRTQRVEQETKLDKLAAFEERRKRREEARKQQLNTPD